VTGVQTGALPISVSSEIRNFDRHLSFRMIEQLIDEQGVIFVDKELETAILDYFKITRESSTFDENLQQENTWNTFVEYLDYQAFQRQRLIDFDCASEYQDPESNLFNIGGACYVK
jgi:hypothetical protein